MPIIHSKPNDEKQIVHAKPKRSRIKRAARSARWSLPVGPHQASLEQFPFDRWR